MREKSEMKSHLSAQMCRLESPSRSVESEPENVVNTASPGRSSSWILPTEMMSTPERPTSSGLQSPSGVPVQFGPSPLTQEYRHLSPCYVPPAQWGNHHAQSPSEDQQLPMCAATAMMHGILCGASSSWQGGCPPIHKHREWVPPAALNEVILPNPGYRVEANIWHLDIRESALRPGPIASFLRHCNTMESPPSPSYLHGGPQPSTAPAQAPAPSQAPAQHRLAQLQAFQSRQPQHPGIQICQVLQRMRRFQTLKEQIHGRAISLGASKHLQDRMSQSQFQAAMINLSALATSFAFRSIQTTQSPRRRGVMRS